MNALQTFELVLNTLCLSLKSGGKLMYGTAFFYGKGKS